MNIDTQAALVDDVVGCAFCGSETRACGCYTITRSRRVCKMLRHDRMKMDAKAARFDARAQSQEILLAFEHKLDEIDRKELEQERREEYERLRRLDAEAYARRMEALKHYRPVPFGIQIVNMVDDCGDRGPVERVIGGFRCVECGRFMPAPGWVDVGPIVTRPLV